MFRRLLEAMFKLYIGVEQVRSLQPGETVTLPPGAFTDRGVRYEFAITVWREAASQRP